MSAEMFPAVEQLVRRFFSLAGDSVDSFYNEACLQHELALFLRGVLPEVWRLHIERPASWFRPAARRLTKKEIDLVIADSSLQEVVAVELKCPRQGQYPEQMFKACQDLEFLEQLVEAGFSGGLFVMHVDDALFYNDGARNGIYAHFRASAPICGTIQKPTGDRRAAATIRGSYTIDWHSDTLNHRYCLQTVGPAR